MVLGRWSGCPHVPRNRSRWKWGEVGKGGRKWYEEADSCDDGVGIGWVCEW